MPFANINVRQTKTITVSGQTSPYVVSLDNPVAANSMVMFLGSILDGSTDRSGLLGTPTGGGTWSSIANVRISTDFGPNPCGAIVTGLSAGSPSFSFPFTANGTPISGDLRISGALIEFELMATSSVLDGAARTGTSATSATTTSAAATGTLAQTDNIIIGIAAGYFGVPLNPATYSSILSQQNGGFPGAQISWKKVTSTASQTFSVAHDAAASPGGAALCYVVKAADAGGLVIDFDFPADGTDAIPAGQASVNIVATVNRDPFTTGTYYYWTGQTAETGTDPSDSTTRRVIVSTGLPSGLVVGDTIRASLQTADASAASVGWIPGTVRAV